MAHRAVRGFMNGNEAFHAEPGLPDDARAALESILAGNRSEDATERLRTLADALAAGNVPDIREAPPAYVAKGPGSWKHAATGITDAVGDGDAPPVWSTRFERSDYRKFHDAVKEHRFVVTQQILPGHGVRLV